MFHRFDCSLDQGEVFHLIDLVDMSLPPAQRNHSIFTSLPVVVSNLRGLVITHPDVMISPTKVAESCSCIRRAVISDRMKSSFGNISVDAVKGNLKHSFMEVSVDYTLPYPKYAY